MSLASFIKNKDVRESFANEFKKPRGKIIGEIKAPPLTSHYGLVGTAFDYLMRFYLERLNPEALTKGWVAENVCEILVTGLKHHGEVKGPREQEIWDMAMSIAKQVNEADLNFTYFDLVTEATDIVKRARKEYSDYITLGKMIDELIKSTLLLAQLDPIYRARFVDRNIGIIDEEDIQDLKNLISVINIDDFKSKSICILNPTFGEGSSLVGGADADIVIDHQMMDIKTTEKLEISRGMFNQIIGYYILGKIGGIGKERIDISNIREIGFYFSRYGMKYMYKVEDIIDFNSLPNFIDGFRDKAKRLFPAKRVA